MIVSPSMGEQPVIDGADSGGNGGDAAALNLGKPQQRNRESKLRVRKKPLVPVIVTELPKIVRRTPAGTRNNRWSWSIIEATSLPKFEIIATRDLGEWQIFVEVETDALSKLHVVQGGAALPQLNEFQPFQFGPLRDLSTPIKVLYDGDTPIERRLITDESPISFFRIHQNLARFVRRPARRTQSGGSPSVIGGMTKRNQVRRQSNRELIGVPGYIVHFFSADRNQNLSFDRPGEVPAVFHCARPKFRLDGQLLPDPKREWGRCLLGSFQLCKAMPVQ